MTRTELVEELERLLGEAAVAREHLQGILAAARALRQSLPPPAPTDAPPTPPPAG